MSSRLAQYEIWSSSNKRLEIAKFFVQKKILNQIKLLERYEIKVQSDLWKIKIKRLDTINSLLGTEGEFSKFYFSKFDTIIKSDLKFEKRSRRPAHNEFNALLNLTYTMTKNNILNKLEIAGFETYIGFLHGVKYGRESLALDLIEEVRSICDLMVIKWVNRGEFKKYDFINSDKGIILTEQAFRKYIKKYSDEYNLNLENQINIAIKEFKSLLKE